MQPEKQKGKIIQIIKLKSELNEDEILKQDHDGDTAEILCED